MTGVTKQQLLETVENQLCELEVPPPPMTLDYGLVPEDTYRYWYDQMARLSALEKFVEAACYFKILTYDDAAPYRRLFGYQKKAFEAEQQRVRALK